jgi:hypothetical protein
MFKMEFQEVSKLPELSWVAKVGSNKVLVWHGAAVERCSSGFVEGVWDAEFFVDGFLDAAVLVGSGGRLVDHDVVFGTATHPLSPLFAVRHARSIYVSNSLALLLVRSGEQLSAYYRYYVLDELRHQDDPDAAHSRVPLASGREAIRFLKTNLRITQDLRLTTSAKSPLPPVATYDQYRSFLAETLKRLFENGACSGRRQAFRPVVSISSGYDSTACAVLAREAGCSEAITFSFGRTGNDRSVSPDSGLDTARRLGLSVTEYDRYAYMSSDALPEPEYLAAGSLDDVVWWAGREQLKHSILLTGTHGDWVWGMSRPTNSGHGSFDGPDTEENCGRGGFAQRDIRRPKESDRCAAVRLSGGSSRGDFPGVLECFC